MCNTLETRMFTSSESQSALPKEFGIEERLSHELYFGNRTSLVETSVCLGKVHLQTFVNNTGFHNTNTSFQEKWLCRISMNSSLTAITHGLKQVKAGQINQLSIKELSLIFYLIIESNNSHHYKETLQLILLKLLPLDESYDILKKCFSKTESGIVCFIDCEVFALVNPIKFHQKLMHHMCDLLSKVKEEDLKNSWIIKASLKNSELFEQLCKGLLEKYPYLIARFVESIVNKGNSLMMYPRHEQPCVALCQIASFLDSSKLKNWYRSQLLKETFELWQTSKSSVLKLFCHFPILVDCLCECCEEDEIAKRLCIQLMSPFVASLVYNCHNR